MKVRPSCNPANRSGNLTTPLKFVILGTGYWARYQLAAWQELGGVECVGLYNRTRSKAQTLAREFGVSRIYDDPEQLLAETQPDFVDIITSVDAHPSMAHLAVAHHLPVICQKPMASSLQEAEEMVRIAADAGVPFLVHENWRWQTPIRQVHRVLGSGHIGTPFRARIQMVSGFPVFENQPFLRELEQFILTDMGSHILDVARFLFGEADSLYCLTQRIHPDIRGEDIATVMLKMRSGATVICELGYSGAPLERDRFPETYIFIEGDQGSLELGPDYWQRTTTREGTLSRRYPPPRYAWADPAYDVVHASIVDCNRDLLRALHGETSAETSASDNLNTVRLVFAAYQSASTGQTVELIR